MRGGNEKIVRGEPKTRIVCVWAITDYKGAKRERLGWTRHVARDADTAETAAFREQAAAEGEDREVDTAKKMGEAAGRGKE